MCLFSNQPFGNPSFGPNSTPSRYCLHPWTLSHVSISPFPSHWRQLVLKQTSLWRKCKTPSLNSASAGLQPTLELLIFKKKRMRPEAVSIRCTKAFHHPSSIRNIYIISTFADTLPETKIAPAKKLSQMEMFSFMEGKSFSMNTGLCLFESSTSANVPNQILPCAPWWWWSYSVAWRSPMWESHQNQRPPFWRVDVSWIRCEVKTGETTDKHVGDSETNPSVTSRGKHAEIQDGYMQVTRFYSYVCWSKNQLFRKENVKLLNPVLGGKQRSLLLYPATTTRVFLLQRWLYC